MSLGSKLSVHIAIAPLTSAGKENFAIWVTNAPYTGGYVHADCLWEESLTAKWIAWQEMFSLQDEIHLPIVHSSQYPVDVPLNPENYGGQLMQELGVSLWRWVFDGVIGNILAQSQGIAMGQNQLLRLRLDVSDPNLIPLPWEIMQSEKGKQPISLNEQILFSRTTHDVAALNHPSVQEGLNILLVVGTENLADDTQVDSLSHLKNICLDEEVISLNKVIWESLFAVDSQTVFPQVMSTVDTLLQPTSQELITALESGNYNLIFYAGHGQPGPDGGVLFLSDNDAINGTELAQVLVRNQVILAVFNACWGAQPDLEDQKTIERSSLAEVLIHHGVPAVLAMRDAIADEEALTFIRTFTKSLCQRMPIDQAVAVARQQLLTVYKFNQPAWTLPILYLHPEFNGELIKPINERITELPELLNNTTHSKPIAYLYSLTNTQKKWRIRGGLMRVGRSDENDVIVSERWVSQKHAEIICRDSSLSDSDSYFLKDFSRFGTLVQISGRWQKVLHQEIPLRSGIQLKFGSIHGETLEFVVERV